MSRGSDGEDFNAHRLAVERWAVLAQAIELLGNARSIESVVETLRIFARRIAGADGITVVLHEDGYCHYVAEDAKAPLWAGQRFALQSCISGIAMRDRTTIVIPDVLADPRVPHEAYRSTFVRSMAMVPIGAPNAVAAVGAYWSEEGDPAPETVSLLETLARAATTALENGRLVAGLEELNSALERRVYERTADLRRAEEIARQAQKMEVIGQLTGNVAHDFNNLLTPIMGSLDLILTQRKLTDNILCSVSMAMEAADRAKLLVQRLLAFARRQPLVRSAVDIADLVRGMENLITSTIGPRIALVVDIATDLPSVAADRHQLEMALLNLAVNARDAMPDGGRLTVAAGRSGPDELPAALSPGDYAWLSLRDNGVGMDEATLAQAVEPFFSTKDVSHGTGLGLSMVDGLAAQLGGTLQLMSTPGIGTEALLWLPVAKTRVARPTAASLPILDNDEKGMAIVIDDEPRVRSATAAMVSTLGYEVVQLSSAAEGLGLIEAGARPDVVLTDHVMPGMSGAEFAQRLRSEHPDIAVMIISGYQGIDLIAPEVVRLGKPFRQKQLADAVRAAREQVLA